MTEKPKGKDAENPDSPEFQAFEDAMKRIIKVPKKDLDKFEAEQRKAKGK